MYRSVTSSVLSADRPSQYSEQLLVRLGLGERFDKNPELVLAALRGPGEGLSREYLFVLSELSFYHAVKSQKAEYFLASAVYAYAFGLGRKDEARLDPLDPRLAPGGEPLQPRAGPGAGGSRGGDRRARAGPAAPALRPDRDQRGRRDAHLVRLSHDAVHLPGRVQGARLPQPLPSGRPRCAARRRADSLPAKGPRPRRRASESLRGSRCP